MSRRRRRTALRILSAPHDDAYAAHIVGLVSCGDGVAEAETSIRVVPGTLRHRDPVSDHAAWVEAHAADFDLYHLHLGARPVSPAGLRRLVESLRKSGRPLVVTLHELRGLHPSGPGAFEEALDVVLPAAAALVTLTPGAAAQIRERWGRDAAVIPHPHVLPLDQLDRPKTRRNRPRVTVPLDDLSPRLDPVPMVEALLESTARRSMDLHISIRHEALEPFGPAEARGLSARLPSWAQADHVRLETHPEGPDTAHWERLRGADLCVLPYRFGTHCRWVEACHDVGTRVLVPELGFFRQQRPGVLTYRRREDGTPVDADVLAALDHVVDEFAAGVPWQTGRLPRTAQRQRIAHLHEQLYRSVL